MFKLPDEYGTDALFNPLNTSLVYDTRGPIHYKAYRYGDPNYFLLRRYVILERAYIQTNASPTVRDVLPTLFDFLTDRFDPGDGFNILMDVKTLGDDTIHVYNSDVGMRICPRYFNQPLPFRIDWTYINEADTDKRQWKHLVITRDGDEWQVFGKWDHMEWDRDDDEDDKLRVLARFKNPTLDIELFAVCAVSSKIDDASLIPCMIIMAHVYTPDGQSTSKAVDQAYIHRIHASQQCPEGISTYLHREVWQLLGSEIKKANVQVPPPRRETPTTPMIIKLAEIGFQEVDRIKGVSGTSGGVLFKKATHTRVVTHKRPATA